jgi:hypothetical protein
MAMTFLKVKPIVARNLKWAGLIFCYQWMIWLLIGVVGSLWPCEIIPWLHSMPLWLVATVFWTLVFFGPTAGYFLLIYRLNIGVQTLGKLRFVAYLTIAWTIMWLTTFIILKPMLATGWFPCFEFHSLRKGFGEYPH